MADSAAPEVVIPNNETPDSSANRVERAAANSATQNTTQLSAEQVAGAAATVGNSQPVAAPLQRQHAAIQIDVNQMANVISVSYLAANGLNNQRNRAGAAGVNFGATGPGQNNIMNMRNRLFHAIYFKIALTYAQMFPKPFQRILEYFFLFKALLFFFALVYVHVSFIKNPATCLDHVHDWPRDGVLRVEVIPNLDKRLESYKRNQAYENSMRNLQYDYFYGIGPKTKNQLHHHKYATNETYTYYLQHESTYGEYLKTKQLNNEYKEDNDNNYDAEQYIIEYSLEYGHLRLSPAARKRLQIPVRVVQLDPLNNKCFGDKFSKFLLKDLLGYDDLLMASVRVIAEKEDNKGYLRNVITGEHYRFISTWWTSCSSYPTAFFVMLLFTFSISMLLRFSHQQIFVFIVDLLQMLEFNVAARFPIAPLLIVILALVGMEAIMSEFFNDTTTAFYIILIVWVADQYDAICCHTSITKRHWLRFFYLYHFAFYAYHYRFCGQNRSLALVSSWLFIQHSMLYFFHHYELPVIMQQAQVIVLNRNQNNNAGGGANVVAGMIQQQQQQQQQQQPHQQQQQANGNGGGIVTNRIFRLVPLQQEQHANAATGQQGVGGQIDGLQMQPQQLPFVGGLLQHYAEQNIGGALGMIRRALFARGWRQPIPVRIQTAGNLQRINLGSIQINPENLARVSSPSSTPTTQTATVVVGTAPMATNTESTSVSAETNATVDATSSTTSISSGIFNTTDVETNQRDESPNPTSAHNITATVQTAKETEALGNTHHSLTESETIQQPTIYIDALENNSSKTSYNLDANASESEKSQGQLDVSLNNAEISTNNKCADNIILKSLSNTNLNGSSNNKDPKTEQKRQQLGAEQQLQSICRVKDKDSNCLEKQKTIENNEENNKGCSDAMAANEGNHVGRIAEVTATIDCLSNTPTIGAVSTKLTSTQNETIQIDVKPEMIDDGTANKPITTTPASSAATPSQSPSPLSATSELNETEISTETAAARATAVGPLVVSREARNLAYNTNCSSSSYTSPVSRLHMVVSVVEQSSTSTTASLPSIITQSNRNQLLNPNPAKASVAASNPTTTTSITDLTTSDADDVQSTNT